MNEQYKSNSAKKVLIVDDEAISAISFREILKFFCYDICELASTGNKAIEIMEQCQPDLVIMDINLKGEMDGVEAAIKIRQDSNVPILFISGYPEHELKKEINAIENTRYLEKPVQPNELFANVSQLIT